MFEISAEISFSAAHALKGYDGACAKLHGHNWIVRATVATDTLDSVGIGFDFKNLKRCIEEVTDGFDHEDLTPLFAARNENASCENIARFIYFALKEKLPGTVSLVEVEVAETPRYKVTFRE